MGNKMEKEERDLRDELGDLVGFPGEVVNRTLKSVRLGEIEFDGNLPLGVTDEVPLLELRNNVLFPHAVTPVIVGRERSLRLISELPSESPYIAVVAQRDSDMADPTAKDLYRVGVLAKVHHVEAGGDEEVGSSLVLEGVCRIHIEEFVAETPYFRVRYEAMPERRLAEDTPEEHHKFEERFQHLMETWKEYNAKVSSYKMRANVTPGSEGRSYDIFVNMLSVHLDLPVHSKQELLECNTYIERVEFLSDLLAHQLAVATVQREIQDMTKSHMEAQQREYILRQQLDTIQRELGEEDAESGDIEQLLKKAARLRWGKETQEVFTRELKRLERMNSMAPDYSIQLSYLQLMVDLPWGKFSKDNYDLERARCILDEDHFGIEPVKERILEYLAVLKLKNDLKAPILCLWGPPGVGKTSLGRSIARALNRKYARISLGGVDDEGEIRGHRRTYVGAMPGRILQNLRKVKTSNPVFILDEIDKLSVSRMGDPASALLEVLDPEQNTHFSDNYLETEFDLSHVLFITTANDISTIPIALQDRMEMIELTGYLTEEKVQIAKHYLVPNQLKEHGVRKSQCKISDALLEKVIQEYTRESGVRKLDQTVAKLVRQQAKKIANEEEFNRTLTQEDVRTRLGVPPYQEEIYQGETPVGVAVGMAWTRVGGDILYVESSLSSGKGTLTMTGNLGDVMKESTTIALQVVRSHASVWSLKEVDFSTIDVHVHVPEGAIPKDGPSAGVTMLTSLYSSFAGKAPKSGMAMTGEITLSGRVLGVGGIKEKILAAKRAKIYTILLPTENKKDIEEIKEDYVEGLDFIYVKNVEELMSAVFV